MIGNILLGYKYKPAEPHNPAIGIFNWPITILETCTIGADERPLVNRLELGGAEVYTFAELIRQRAVFANYEVRILASLAAGHAAVYKLNNRFNDRSVFYVGLFERCIAIIKA